MKKQGQNNRNQGFTLVETLAAVAILVILLGASMVAAAGYRDYLKITELDNAAREIYMAAENRAVLLANSRRLSGLVVNGEKTNAITLSAGSETPVDPAEEELTAYYLSNTDGVMSELLPTGSIDPALLEGCFYLVYEPVSGCVTDVFYAEKEITPGNFQSFYDKWTKATRDARMRAASEVGAMLGYYGGGMAEGADTGAPSAATVNVIIENREQLTVTVTYTLPDGVDESDVKLSVKLGNIELTDAKYNNRRDGNTWVLDSLEAGEQFKDLKSGLAPGQNFTITATVESMGNQFDSATASATDNSLFAKDSGATAKIGYLRHLQNLDFDFSEVTNTVTAAEQTADITCFHNDVYSDYEFKPIVNGNLARYDGKTKVIRDLCVTAERADGKPGGLFSSASGVSFQDIRLVNASVTASGVAAGALVGAATNATFDGCWVYWEPERGETNLRSLLGSDEAGKGYQYQITGADAGGLVGILEGGTIKNCLAATTVKGTNVTGGLIGRASGTSSITNSYADCYLTGDSAAGLIGDLNDSVTLTNCYAAGFISVEKGDNGSTAAGLCLGSGTTSATNVYTVVRYSRVEAEAGVGYYPLTQQENDAFSSTYYLSTGSAGGDSGKTYADMTDNDFLTQMGNNFAWKDSRASNPYNLQEHLNLVVYSFPGLKTLPHYGDWAAEFKEPSLVYYEQYLNSKYGFSGGNARFLIGELDNDKTILKDGYAVAFLEKDFAEAGATSAQITYTYFSDGAQKTKTVSCGQAELIPATYNDAKYYLVPLPDDLVNSGAASENFYQYLKFELTLGSSLTSGEYFYNPHFAETVVPYVGDFIEWSQETAEEYAGSLANSGKLISIRTPRHLYSLSKFVEYYSNDRYYRFSQELDLDYGSYTGYDLFLAAKGEPFSQQPIGSWANHFNGVYDGGCHKIMNLAFHVPKDSDRYYAGLFGYTEGTLLDIVYEMDPVVPLNEAMGDGSKNLYIGGLAGGNSGTVQNCAVSGINLNGMAFGATIYIGGLVGQNNGIIRNCAAESASLSMDGSSYAYGYVGGLTGENTASISASYAVGRLTATVDTNSSARICGFVGYNSGNIYNSYAAVDLQSSGTNVETLGFCGKTAGDQQGTFYLNEGNFTYRGVSYAANRTAVKAAPVVYEVLTVRPDPGVPTQPSVQPLLSAGMEWEAAVSGTTETFPYPTAVRDANGQPVHYGEYPRRMELGEMGVYYWEKLVINGKSTYHISLLAVDPSKKTITRQTTLSETHNDGGVVAEYGYGYYTASSVKDQVKLTVNNIAYIEYIPYTKRQNFLNVSDKNNWTKSKWTEWDTWDDGKTDNEKAADAALADLMPGYVFHSWNTYHEGARAADDKSDTTREDIQTRGLSLFKSKQTDTLDPASGAFTLKQGGVAVTFIVNPQFAASISVKEDAGMALKGGATKEVPGSAGNPFQVRCGMQLQDINWYDTAYTDVPVGTSTYTSNRFPYLSGKSDGTVTKDYYWKQTHDMDWTGEWNAARPDNAGGVFFAIAPAYVDSYELKGWFGGHYDGQNYIMKNFNIAINTENYNVNCMGLFGAVKDAELKDIVMFSEGGNDTITINGRKDAGDNAWYAGGALAGLAQNSTITNCAVAGYTIMDETERVPTHSGGYSIGGAIGGLVGMTDGELSGCTASTTIILNYSRSNAGNAAPLRVGGLVGSTTSRIENCYAGGKIWIRNRSENNDGNEDYWELSTIYAGGIVGGVGMVLDGKGSWNNQWNASVTNCYSYTWMEKSWAKGLTDMLVGIYGPPGSSYTPIAVSDNEKNAMTTRNNYYLIGTGGVKSQTSGVGTGLTYQQLAGEEDTGSGQNIYSLLPAFRPVTSIIGEFSVSGKYSYPPSSRIDLQGLNYPFPTILTREDVYHVHYGEWPTNGILRDEGGRPIALDLFAKPVHTETLALTAGITNGTWSVASASPEVAEGSIDGNGNLTVTAKDVGTTKLTVSYTGCTPFEITVNVTANLTLQPSTVTMFSNASVTVPVKVFGQDPSTMGGKAVELPQTGFALSGVTAAGLNSSEVSWPEYVAPDPDAGTEEKIPGIKLSSGADPAVTMVNVTYSYPYEEKTYPGASAITVTTVNPPECRMSEDWKTCTIDFSAYRDRVGSLEVEITRGEDESIEITAKDLVITAVNPSDVWAVDLKITLTMDGNTHELTVTPGAPPLAQ